ncbi:MAG TPA: HAMP domain-containing sensor histidine kinase [Acidimicrobiales bacterium]|nr:HAMP domain-containing sensor histidine kinase [Acidimicrobiales bacterium]
MPARRRLSVRTGFRARATLAFAAGAVLIAVMLSVPAFFASRSYLTSQRESSARRQAYANARLVRNVLRSPDADPARLLGSLQRDEGTDAVFRVGDKWFASSVATSRDALPGDLVAVVGRGHAGWQRYRLRDQPVIAVGVPVPAVNAMYFEVNRLTQLDSALRAMSLALLLASIVTTIGGGIIGFILSGNLVRPIRMLAARAEAVAAGDATAFDEADAELAPLVGSLNRVIEGYATRAEREARFASDVSHELRAPLAALSAAVDVMQRRRTQLPDGTTVALDALSEQIDGFQALVLDLLEMSRFDAGRAELVAEPTDLRELITHALASIGAWDVPVLVDPAVPSRLVVDRRRIAQALVNLVENARRYGGGATAVKAWHEADAVRLAVEDHGPGVLAEDRERVFDRFERGSLPSRADVPKGTGLGLALVREHAALHGGSAWVEDVDPAGDGGARFVIEIPVRTP